MVTIDSIVPGTHGGRSRSGEVLTAQTTDLKAAPETPEAIGRRIAWNRKAFSNYNIDRVREMLRYLPGRRVRLFEAIPFLIHVNHPELTGYITSPGAPFGISGFYRSGYWKRGLKQFGFSQAAMRPFLPDEFGVIGLYLMGSIGTLAQTRTSDFDYWVVVDEVAKDPVKRALLEKKLDRISEWGQATYDQQITFFILDIDRVRNCDFTAVDAESSGSAQKTLLKEEFYRTFIVVAGKVPYWAVLPPQLTDADYHRWIGLAGQARTTAFDKNDYLDLGPLEKIDPAECLGALLWQIYKARHDPVKAVIKGALIANYYFFQDESGLLCDRAKGGFSEAGQRLGPEDPYAAVFELAEGFYDLIQDTGGHELIRTCIFLRLIGFPQKRPVVPGSPKEMLLKRFLKQWQWPQKTRNDLENYENWPITRLIAFEAELIKRLGFLFELVRQDGIDHGRGFSMSPTDLKGLKNRIAAVFKPRNEKVPRCPLVIRKSMHRAVVLAYTQEPARGWRFSLAGDGPALLESTNLVYIAGWMVRNRMMGASQRNLRLQSAGQSLAADRIRQLFSKTGEYFSQAPTVAENFQTAPVIDRLLAVVSDEPSAPDGAGTEVTILWRNSWGELFSRKTPIGNSGGHWSRCYGIADCIQAVNNGSVSTRAEYRIWDYRIRPERNTEATVLDMLASMAALNGE